jgi:membrane-associated phospholipid phosphatase
MNAEISRLLSTGRTSSDMRAIWPGALLVGYLAITSLLVLIGWSRVPAGGVILHVGVLLAIAATTWLSKVPRWLHSWAPLMALLFLYSEMPLLILAAGHRELYDATVIAWERALFGQPALDWAAAWPSRVLSEVLHLAYASYYLIIFSVPAALYLSARREEYQEAVFVLMLTFVTCFLIYVVFPVAGPRYLTANRAVPAGPIRDVVVWLLEARSSRGTAFPSSHVAVALTQSILAVRYFGARGATLAVLTAALGLGAVYGGFHYLVDVIAGALVGIVITAVGLAAARLLARRSTHANATAPT